jgi:hypothetical protein
MPKKRKEPAQPPPSTASVEVQRLQALVETQRLHIEELNHQLQETLVRRACRSLGGWAATACNVCDSCCTPACRYQQLTFLC